MNQQLTFLCGVLASWAIWYLFSAHHLVAKLPNLSALFGKGAQNDVKTNAGDGVYRVVHEKLNKQKEWEIYEPSQKQKDDSFAFLVYFRRGKTDHFRMPEILVKVQDDKLKKILRNCLQYIDTVFDFDPMV